jgi:hypothetical protein
MDFTNKNGTFKINFDASFVIYNNKSFVTTKIYLFSPISAKLTFDIFLVKWSKNELNIYKNSILIETFYQNYQSIILPIKNNTENSKIFQLKEGYLIELVELLENGSSYILNDTTKEEIININCIGLYWTEYTTNLDNKLTVSSNKEFHNKFNGIPIGRV